MNSVNTTIDTEEKIQHDSIESWNIGMRRVDNIIESEKLKGYDAWATGMHSRLPDILVFDPTLAGILDNKFDTLVRVYEVTNYRTPEMYIASDRIERYKNTLLQFDAEKFFVCSYEENLRYVPGGKQYFEDLGIWVIFAGPQD